MLNKPIAQVLCEIEEYLSIDGYSQLVALVKDYGLLGAIDYLDPNKSNDCAVRDTALVSQHHTILCCIAGVKQCVSIWRWSTAVMSWILVAGESDILPDRESFLGNNWCVVDGSKITYLCGSPREDDVFNDA